MPRYVAKVVTADYQIMNTDDMILLDVSSNGVVARFPDSPSAGQTHIVAHHTGDVNTNYAGMVRGDSGLLGGSENVQLSVDQASITWTYIDAAVGWKVTSAYRAG